MIALKQRLIKDYKEKGYADSEATAEVGFAIEIISGLSKKELAMGCAITPTNEKQIIKAVERRLKTQEPLAHILGATFFMNEKFIVTKDTLIPRPETELLVIQAIDIIEKYRYTQVLDLGTGSGCIACMLAKMTSAQIIGVDISKNALGVALDNTMKLNLMNKALFRKSDFFSNISEKFDLIVSNPPYIPQKDKENMQFEVLEYEPELALFTNDEKGIENYEKIISQAHNYLNPQGHVVFELGISQSELVADILNFYGFEEIEILKDLSEIDRVISARKV